MVSGASAVAWRACGAAAALFETSMMLEFEPSTGAVSLRVTSTNAPGVMLLGMTMVAVLTALSLDAVHGKGIVSPDSAMSPEPLEMLLMFQSSVFHATSRQTGSLNVTLMRFPATVMLWKVGAVVSW